MWTAKIKLISRKKIIISIILLFIVSMGFISRYVQQTSINEDNFNELLNLLKENQNIKNYVVSFVSGGYTSGGAGGYTRYNITIKNETIVQGPSDALTATDIKNKIKNKISNWTQLEKEEIIKFFVLGKKCFDCKGLILCFDDENNLVYYHKLGQFGELWVIPSLFSLPPKNIVNLVNDELYKAQMKKLREKKIEDCNNEACEKFFSMLDAPNEYEYEVREEYEIKPYGPYTLDYRYVLNYKIENEKIKSFERVDGVYGGPKSESMLKAQLSEFQLSCDFKYSKRGRLTCFEFKISASRPKCELRSNYKRNNCSYCFDPNGYLVLASCSGNGYWKWEKHLQF